MKQLTVLGLLPLLILVVLWGCDNDTSNDVSGPGGATDKTCIGCHSSESELKAALGVEEKVQDFVLRIPNKDDG